MVEKKCTKCKVVKTLNLFGKADSKKDGLSSWCKKCVRDAQDVQSLTKAGVVRVIYSGQVASSKKRKHLAPDYSATDLKDWLYSQPLFHELYSLWKRSGYDSRLKPSCDREDDNLGYSFKNIALKTWGENKDKEYERKTKKIIQLTKDNKHIKTFDSLTQAAKETGARKSHISSVCSGRRKTTGGFKWEYSND